MTVTQVIYNPADIDFARPGKHHYQVAFHLDGAWGYSLVPLTVINGAGGSNPNGIVCFGGTHGNEYEGQIAVKRLCNDLNPEEMSGRVILIPQLSESACIARSASSPTVRTSSCTLTIRAGPGFAPCPWPTKTTRAPMFESAMADAIASGVL